jgi:hypothetical protein
MTYGALADLLAFSVTRRGRGCAANSRAHTDLKIVDGQVITGPTPPTASNPKKAVRDLG